MEVLLEAETSSPGVLMAATSLHKGPKLLALQATLLRWQDQECEKDRTPSPRQDDLAPKAHASSASSVVDLRR